MAFTEPTEGELQSAEDIAAARQAFLAEPPAILDPNEPPPVDDAAAQAAAEAAALDELTQPPAAPEGASTTESTAPPPAPAPAGTPDPFAQYGGAQAVEQAWQVQQALRTEQGIRALVANGLIALGYDANQVKEALDAAEGVEPQGAPAPTAPVAVDPFAGLDDEDVVTVKDVKGLLQQVAAQAAAEAASATQAQLAPVQEAVLTQQQTAVRQTADSALLEVLGPFPADPAEQAAFRSNVDQIVARAQAYYDPAQWANPTHVRDTIVRAHAEIQSENDARFRAYLETKKRARDAQPPNVGGGAGGEAPPPEPKNMDEAREQARKAGFFN